VLWLTADLRQVDVFAPADWAALSRSDTDLGSLSPTLVGSDLVLQAGKASVGYLLAAARLAGVGGQRFGGHVCAAAFVAAAAGVRAVRGRAGGTVGGRWAGAQLPGGLAQRPLQRRARRSSPAARCGPSTRTAARCPPSTRSTGGAWPGPRRPGRPLRRPLRRGRPGPDRHRPAGDHRHHGLISGPPRAAEPRPPIRRRTRGSGTAPPPGAVLDAFDRPAHARRRR
jgi:hypothetical protein